MNAYLHRSAYADCFRGYRISPRKFCYETRRSLSSRASPQKIIADGTDWRFLNELKKELKA